MGDFSARLSELCLKLYSIDILKFGDFKMKVGMNSPIYFDLRSIISFPVIMNELTELMIEFMKMKQSNPKLLCGVPYTALPISTVISVKTQVPMVIRRKEKKSYGTMKLVEGRYQPGEEVVIIEDVVTSGSSIIETVNDLKNDGLTVKEAFVILDREQGGATNLSNHGIKMNSLLTCTQLLDILHKHGKVTQETLDKVQRYLADHQITPNGDSLRGLEERLEMSYKARADVAKCAVAREIFQLMERKKSNLCIAIDVQNKQELLQLVKQVGEHACVIKTHFDAVVDWDLSLESELQQLAQKYDFIIMEDRKLGDIGRTVLLQCNAIFRWAKLATMHSVGGLGSLVGAAEAASSSSNQPHGIFLVAQLSSKGNLITPQYTKAAVELAKKQGGLIAGIVCQNSDVVSEPGFIQMTPGVSTERGDDDLGQQYIGLEEAVLKQGADLVVIGRVITQNSDPASIAQNIRQTLWQSYLKRISTK